MSRLMVSPHIKNDKTALLKQFLKDNAIPFQDVTTDLYTWLQEIDEKLAIANNTEIVMVEFVKGMMTRGLEYHWEDDANDCLACHIDTWEGDLINAVVSKLFDEGWGERMFGIVLEELDKNEPFHDDPQLKALRQLVGTVTDTKDKQEVQDYIDKRVAELRAQKGNPIPLEFGNPGIGKSFSMKDAAQFDKKCICDIRDLCTQGCKCGGK